MLTSYDYLGPAASNAAAKSGRAGCVTRSLPNSLTGADRRDSSAHESKRQAASRGDLPSDLQ
jgi:hypothetical protein